ncbi:MAG: glycosyltransferase family 4 protein [Candidatus Krumholzibacteriia bacterium]
MNGPVAIVATGELFGGAERHIVGLGAFLAARGLSPRVILFYDRELASQCRKEGLPVQLVPTRSAYDTAGPRRVGEALAKAGCRLAHVHGYKAAVNVALAPGDHAMVCTLHGQGEPTWRTPRVFLKDRLYRSLEQWSCRRRQAAVCFVTRDLAARHGRRYGALLQRTVHNGIEPLERQAQGPRPAGLVPDRLHALMVGRLTGVKAIDVAVDALALLPDGHRWHLDLVGDGGLRGDLEAQVSRLGLRDRVTFHGFRRDVFALMAHSDLLLMTSHHEGLPYTLLEAMSLGLPTLASDVGGLAEVLRHGETGWLVPPNDPPAVADALATLAADPSLRQRLGEAAAREQRARYTLSAMGEQYLAVYDAVLSGRR